jgi:hypothetical protein
MSDRISIPTPVSPRNPYDGYADGDDGFFGRPRTGPPLPRVNPEYASGDDGFFGRPKTGPPRDIPEDVKKELDKPLPDRWKLFDLIRGKK